MRKLEIDGTTPPCGVQAIISAGTFRHLEWRLAISLTPANRGVSAVSQIELDKPKKT